MKKLFTIFSVVSIFCLLTAGSAVAQGSAPVCGKFLLSTGTTYNTLDGSLTPVPLPANSVSTCTAWDGGIAWALQTIPDSCQSTTTLIPFEVTVHNPKGGALAAALGY